MRPFALVLLPGLCLASVTVTDLSDIIQTSDFADDNSVLPAFNLQDLLYIPTKVAAENFVTQPAAFDHTIWSTTQDQTSALLVSSSSVNASFCQVSKTGRPKDVWSAELVGQNAAVHLTNGSTGLMSFSNITSHNGAIGAMSTVLSTLRLDRSSIYTTGPCAHGMWSSLGGVIRGQFNLIQTNGMRSATVGAGTNGSTQIYNAIVHSTGRYSSPLVFGTGSDWSFHGEAINGNADASPIGIFDGSGTAWLSDSSVIGSGIAGFISTSTGDNIGVQVLEFSNNWLTSSGGGPVFWFGHVNATVQLFRTTISTGRDAQETVLVIANRSQTSPDYTTYGSILPTFSNSTMSPAWVTINVEESVVGGDLLCLLGSYIKWVLVAKSVWYGSTFVANALNAASAIDVTIAPDCTWVLTHDAFVQGLYAPDKNLTNVIGNGHNISYAGNYSLNAWLGGETRPLANGGFAVPY